MATITDAKCWIIPAPAVGGHPGLEVPAAWTVTRIHAYVVGGTSAALNIEERTAIGSAGTNILTSDLTADLDGAFSTDFANAGLAAGNTLWVDISNVTGVVTFLVITMRYTYEV